MVTRTSSTRRTPAFSATQSSVQPSPTISSIVVTDSNYVDLDDTAINTTGGYIKLKGFGFTANSLVLFNGANVTNTYVSSTEYRAVIPATSAGSYNILLFKDNIGCIYAGSSVSGFPTWTTSSYTNYSLTVSVQLLATGDGTLTYSLYSGTLPSGLTLSANGLISGTTTGDSVTSDLVFLVNDSQNQTTQQTVSLTIVSSDTYWKNTVLALTGEAFANNSVYDDASDLNSVVTVNGDTRPSRLSPFASPTVTDGSAYFDGTGDYLSIADSASLRIGTSDFTIEGWFYATNVTGQRGIIAKGPNAASTGWEIRINGAVAGELAMTYSSTVLSGSTVLATNTWYHFALVRSGTASGNIKLYLNGVQEGTSSTARNDDFSQTDAMYIGYTRQTASPQPFLGFISNVRVTKQALYTGNFTVSSSALTTTSQSANTANVVYLGCQTNIPYDNNKIVDYANTTTNDTFVTRTGSVTQGTFSPYGSNWAYYDDGASILAVPANSNYTIGTNNFTLELWTNLPTFTNAALVTSHQSGGMIAVSVSTSGFAGIAINTSGGSSTAYTSLNLTTDALTLGKWYHLAWVRNGTEVAIFVNGVKNATTLTLAANTNIGSYGGAKAFYIGGGSDRGSKLTGYISNVRFVKGTAVYTSNFTPSTTPLTAIANTQFLICQDNRFKDNGANNATLTLDTATPKISRPGPFTASEVYTYDTIGGSYYFNGSTDYFRIATATTALGLSTTDFTIEFWVYFNSVASGFCFDLRSTVGGATQVKPTLYLSAAGTLSYYANGATRLATTVAVGQWYHIAVTKLSGNTKIYNNGTANATTYVDTFNYGASSNLTVGSAGDNPGSASTWLSGYMSDIRVVKGTAVYTANFTPPTAPLTAIANTSILLNAKSAGVIDYTGINNIITAGGSKRSTLVEKNGTGSIYFDGSADYLTIPASTDVFGIANSDFTIEGWMYSSNVTSGNHTICATRTTAADTTAGRFSLMLTGSALNFYSGSANVVAAGTVTVNTWTHFAATRSSGSLRLFLGGTQVGSTTTFTTTMPSALALTVGDNAAGTESWNGYLDDVRVTKGYARYVANFTVPTNTFPLL